MQRQLSSSTTSFDTRGIPNSPNAIFAPSDLVECFDVELQCDWVWNQLDSSLTYMLDYGQNGLPRRLPGHWLSTKMLISRAYSALERSSPFDCDNLDHFSLLNGDPSTEDPTEVDRGILTALCSLTELSAGVHRRLSVTFMNFLSHASGLRMPCDPHPSSVEAFSIMISKYLTSEFATVERLRGRHENLGLFDLYPVFLYPPAASAIFSLSPAHSRHLPMSASALVCHYLAWSAMNDPTSASVKIFESDEILADGEKNGDKKAAFAKFSANSWVEHFHVAHLITSFWEDTVGGRLALCSKKLLKQNLAQPSTLSDAEANRIMSTKIREFFASLGGQEREEDERFPGYVQFSGNEWFVSAKLWKDVATLEDLMAHQYLCDSDAHEIVKMFNFPTTLSTFPQMIKMKIALNCAMLRDLKVVRSKAFRQVCKIFTSSMCAPVGAEAVSLSDCDVVLASLVEFINDLESWPRILHLGRKDLELLICRARETLEMGKLCADVNDRYNNSFRVTNSSMLRAQNVLKRLTISSLEIVENWFFCDALLSKATVSAFEAFGEECKTRLFGAENLVHLLEVKKYWLPQTKHYALLARKLVVEFARSENIELSKPEKKPSERPHSGGFPRQTMEMEIACQVATTMDEMGVKFYHSKAPKPITLLFSVCEKSLRITLEEGHGVVDHGLRKLFDPQSYPPKLQRLAREDPKKFKMMVLRFFDGGTSTLSKEAYRSILVVLQKEVFSDVKKALTAIYVQQLGTDPKEVSAANPGSNARDPESTTATADYCKIWQECISAWEFIGLEEKLELRVPVPNPTLANEFAAQNLWMMGSGDRALSCAFYYRSKRIQLMGDLQRLEKFISAAKQEQLVQPPEHSARCVQETELSFEIVEASCKKIMMILSSKESLECDPLQVRNDRLQGKSSYYADYYSFFAQDFVRTHDRKLIKKDAQ